MAKKKLLPKSAYTSQSINTYRMEIHDFTHEHFVEAVNIPGLRELSLNSTVFNPDDLTLLEQCQSLTHLSIRINHIRAKPLKQLSMNDLRALSELPIVHLELVNANITDPDLEDFPVMSRLKMLDLQGNNISGRGLVYLATKCPQLKWLGLKPIGLLLRDADFKEPLNADELIRSLPMLDSLKEVQIDEENIELREALKALGAIEVS